MGEKKQNKNKGEKKGDGNEGGKKEDSGPITVVLKTDLHCEGCGTKLVKYLKGLDGVENGKADSDTSKVKVIGKVDPSMPREKLEQKTKKKADDEKPKKVLLPKKDASGGGGGGEKKGKDRNKKNTDYGGNKPGSDHRTLEP